MKLLVGYLATPGGADALALGIRFARTLDAELEICIVLPPDTRAPGMQISRFCASGLDAINDGTRKWLLGETRALPKEITSEDGLLWTRMYSASPGPSECKTLDETLKALSAKRMVMGHTPQKPDISAACDEKAWRIDTGMSKHYGGPVEVLEIRGDAVKVLKEEPGR